MDTGHTDVLWMLHGPCVTMKNLGAASRARQTGADPHRAMARASTDASTRASRGSVEKIVVDEDVAVEEEEGWEEEATAWMMMTREWEDDLNARDGLEASTSRASARESDAVEDGDAFVASGRSEVVGTSRRRPWWAMGVETAARGDAATRRAETRTSVVDIVPREDGGQTRARIVREHGASLMRFVEDVQLEERSRAALRAPKRTRKTAREFRAEASAATARFRRVTARGFRITKRVVAKRARGMFEVSARLVGELQKEELRRDVFTATRRGAIFAKRVIQGIEVQVPPLVGFRFDERHVTALWARLASAMSRRFGFVARMRRERLARKKRREEESRAKAEADAKRVGKERAEAPPQEVYMRDLKGSFDKVSDDQVEFETEDLAELLSPQSIATSVDADGALRILAAEPSSSTPKTVEISLPGADLTFGEQSVDNYSMGGFIGEADSDVATFESPKREESSAQSHSVHDISMSPDPQAKAFVRRIEDDLKRLAGPDVEEISMISMRILSVEDKRLVCGAFRGWLNVCEKRRVGESSDDADVTTDEEALMALFDASLASKVELAKRVFALDSDSDEFDELLEEATARSVVDITAAHHEASEVKEDPIEERVDAVDTEKIASEHFDDVVVSEQAVNDFDEDNAIAMSERVVNDSVDAPLDTATSERPTDDFDALGDVATGEVHLSAPERPGGSTMREDDGSETFEGTSAKSEEMLEELIEDSGVEIYPAIPVDALDRYADEVRSLSEQLALMKSEQLAMSQLAEQREMELRNSISLVRGQEEIDNGQSEITLAQKEELKELKEELNRLRSEQDSFLRMVDEKNSVFRQSLASEQKEQSAAVPSNEMAKQSKEIKELKELIAQLKSEQRKLSEESERRERELRTSFATEKDDLEKKLRESLTIERMQLEEEFAKSLMLERGGLEEQLHKGDEYLDSEIQRLQEELLRVQAEQVNAIAIASPSPRANDQPLISQSTPGTPLFTLDTEADVSMEWDVYKLREELDAVKAESASISQLADAREELRRSLALDKTSVESTIRQEVVRALGQIEVEGVNASQAVAQRTSRAQKLLDDASSLVEDKTSRAQEMLDKAKSLAQATVDRLKERERQLNALTSAKIDVSPLKPALSSGGPKATISALERGRQRRRLLHGVTDTFSLSEIINQAQTLASEMEFSFNK